MASSSSRRCLTKPPPYHRLLQFAVAPLCMSPSPCNVSAGAFFSTSSIHPASPNDHPRKGTNTLRIAKKLPIVEKGKPPAEGERKAMRKRIILTNSNALEVELPVFNKTMIDKLADKSPKSEINMGKHKQSTSKKADLPKNLKEKPGTSGKVAELEQELVGTIIRLPENTIDCLRAADAFKITQSWALFRHPAILIREECKTLAKSLAQAEEKRSTITMIIDGAKGTGKSMMLLHAMAIASLNNWVVIHIPEGW